MLSKSSFEFLFVEHETSRKPGASSFRWPTAYSQKMAPHFCGVIYFSTICGDSTEHWLLHVFLTRHFIFIFIFYFLSVLAWLRPPTFPSCSPPVFFPPPLFSSNALLAVSIHFPPQYKLTILSKNKIFLSFFINFF